MWQALYFDLYVCQVGCVVPGVKLVRDAHPASWQSWAEPDPALKFRRCNLGQVTSASLSAQSRCHFMLWLSLKDVYCGSEPCRVVTEAPAKLPGHWARNSLLVESTHTHKLIVFLVLGQVGSLSWGFISTLFHFSEELVCIGKSSGLGVLYWLYLFVSFEYHPQAFFLCS